MVPFFDALDADFPLQSMLGSRQYYGRVSDVHGFDCFSSKQPHCDGAWLPRQSGIYAVQTESDTLAMQ